MTAPSVIRHPLDCRCAQLECPDRPATTTRHSVALAAEMVRAALAGLEEALDQAQDREIWPSAYITVRELERQCHAITDKTGRLLEFMQTGPR